MPHDGRRAPRWDGESQDDAVGPQGAALILELQRLRQAFEQENRMSRTRANASSGARGVASASRANAPAAKRQRKGKMGRAFDVCLEQLGLTASRSGRAPERKCARTGGSPAWRGANPRPSRLRAGWRRIEPASEPVAAPIRRRSEQVREPAVTPVMRRTEPGARRLPLRPREEANPSVSRHPRRRRAGAARSSHPTTRP